MSPLFFLFSLTVSASWVQTHFNRDKAIVRFQLYGKTLDDEALDLDKIIGMIKVISTKFSRIQFKLTTENKDEGARLIPKAVATFNNQLKRNSTAPIKMDIFVDFDDFDSSIPLLRYAVLLANHSNSIYPGTVNSFTLDYVDWNRSCHSLEFPLYKQMEVITPSAYKIGIYFLLSDAQYVYNCMRANFRSMLSKLDFFLFWGKNLKEDNVGTVKYQLSTVFKEFAATKSAIALAREKSGGTPADFIFRIDYSLNKKYGDAELVDFWQRLSNWTWATNNTCFFYEAFDDPWANRKYGWWRTAQNQTYGITSDEYEEKELALMAKMLEENRIKKETNVSKNTGPKNGYQLFMSAISLGISVLIAAYLCFIKHMYRKESKKKVISKPICRMFYEGLSSTPSNGQNPLEYEIIPYDQSLEIADGDFQVVNKQNQINMHIANKEWRGPCQNIALSLGQIKRENNLFPVVVKCTNDSSSELDVMKLLNEIKLLSYLRKHENVIEILGANTSHLRKGILYIFTENHSTKNLHGFLKECKSSSFLQNTIELELLKWPRQIADAMVFLNSKNVVIGNLSARNILLSLKKEIKVSFGDSFWTNLNGQDLEDFLAENNTWRWSAPETIYRLEFNEWTDVWSYGVTLWEIFTFGETPFPDIFGSEFLLSELSSGRTLPQPLQFCTNNAHVSVIEKCTHLHPCHRPSFQQIRTELEDEQGSTNECLHIC